MSSTSQIVRLECIFCVLLFGQYALAQFTEFENSTAWLAATGSHTTIGFNDLPVLTTVTNQYVGEGVVFTDGTDFTVSGFNLPQDGFGLQGGLDGIPIHFPQISFDFSSSQHGVAAHYRGFLQFELYSEDKLIYTSTVFGSPGIDHFAGIISNVPIDRVRLLGEDRFDVPIIDNLYFAVPAPGGLTVMALVGVARRTRRR